VILFKKINDLNKWLDAQRKKGLHVGFVPTMGALHPGHLSLIHTSKAENNVTVCSIFVNPAQFNDPGDFEKYPVTIEQDIALLEEAGCNVLFLPSVAEIYPMGLLHLRHFDLSYLETILEGKYRPGHFQGVCLVVDRLLDIVNPNKIYLGQKDYQQCMVITRMIILTGKEGKIKVRICPTLREADGLAMSSRNMRLNEKERKSAAGIYQCLLQIKKNLSKGNLEKIKEKAVSRLIHSGFRPDYAEIADAENLNIVHEWNGKQPLVAVIAAFLNDIRLIDNLQLTGEIS